MRFLIKRFSERVPRKLSRVRFLGSPVENAELARSEYYEGKTVLESLPTIVNFVVTTYCNSATPCLPCGRNTRPPHVDSDTDEGVIEMVTPLLKTALGVVLHMGGEPMFSAHFDRVIGMVEPPTRVQFLTNGMLMTRRRTDLMLEKDIMGVIYVSLDAATPEVYRIMRPSLDFRTVVGNVEYYIERAAALRRAHSRVSLSIVICRTNIRDVPKLVDLAADAGAVSVLCRHINVGMEHTVKTVEGWDWVYTDQARFEDPVLHDELILEGYERARSRGIELIFYGKPFIGPEAHTLATSLGDRSQGCDMYHQPGEGPWTSPKHKVLASGSVPCFNPWRQVTIEPRGEVRACCFHEMSRWQIGNIMKSDMMAIWNSRAMIKEREQFLEHGVARSCISSIPCVHRDRV